MSVSETFPVDENGLRIRYGRDPKMVMEFESDQGESGAEGEGEAQAQAQVGTEGGDESAGSEGGEAKPQEDDLSKWTLEDAVAKVKETRQEAAKYRTRAQKFETAFSDLDDATTEGLLGLVAALKNGDAAAVPVLENILAELSPKEQEALKEVIEDTPKNLTPEEVDKLIEDREQKKEADRAAQEQFNAMKTEIEGLGYSLDESKPNPDTALLFFFLGQQPGDASPDIKKAHEQVNEFRNGLINEWKDSVKEKNSRFARLASAGGTPQGQDGGKKNLKLNDGSAGKAALEFLANAE